MREVDRQMRGGNDLVLFKYGPSTQIADDDGLRRRQILPDQDDHTIPFTVGRSRLRAFTVNR